MKSKFIVYIAIAALFLSGCSTAKRIEALKPEPSNNEPVAFENSTSFINLPVTISIADIETQVNKLLSGIIYEDKNIDDDNISMKVWKTAPIKFSEQKGRLQTIVPIKIIAKVKYGVSALGVSLYDTREVNMNGITTFNSKIGLTNWKMTTSTNIESLEWKENPSISIGGQQVNVSYLINPAVKLFKSEIENELDKAISKTTDFKPQVLEALEKISEPFLANEQYETWFKLTPIELYVTDAELSKKQITMEMGLKCTMQTVVGQKPLKTFKKEDVILKPVSKMPDKINVVVAAVSTYESASKIITKNFKGQEFGNGSKKVTVQKVELWSKEGKMIIALDMTGSINGTIYLSGYPSYNTVTNEIYFDKLDYLLTTKSVLLKTANWLAEGTILRKIQDNCRYSIKENLDDGKKNITPYLDNYSPMPGIYINGTLDDFEFDKITLTNKVIVAFIKSSGKMSLKIDGMK
ncbi:DUF4403 family protein [Flavobacterium arcticum]|uniref:DUF4403 family protein n=1 Tax=Flavobacterium arcticum TaxID=1784713 RepID=A0A345H9X2_9FLAO|nr:DUF4403 family protein [Flavobacterium arcticum]AXG73382.1 DUF4403 family protein [Flavobacterium arcticum]KAF2513172.1 DUF4403 family protein [Flavobacterium arcticum]